MKEIFSGEFGILSPFCRSKGRKGKSNDRQNGHLLSFEK